MFLINPMCAVMVRAVIGSVSVLRFCFGRLDGSFWYYLSGFDFAFGIRARVADFLPLTFFVCRDMWSTVSVSAVEAGRGQLPRVLFTESPRTRVSHSSSS